MTLATGDMSPWRAIEAAGFREVLARWYTCGRGLYTPVLGGIAYV
jgi:hypothetical protein